VDRYHWSPRPKRLVDPAGPFVLRLVLQSRHWRSTPTVRTARSLSAPSWRQAPGTSTMRQHYPDLPRVARPTGRPQVPCDEARQLVLTRHLDRGGIMV